MKQFDRFQNYKADHCFQHEIGLLTRKEDLKQAGLTEKEAAGLRVKDFSFSYVDKTDRPQCTEIKKFIEKHEWVGKMPNRPTHRFVARLRSNGVLTGVVVMATPNTFCKLLGDKTQHLEKLLGRGACAAFKPKNLPSWLIMKSIRWMLRNTEFRLYTAYADPEAKELGTIYSSCGFWYISREAGTVTQYFDPQDPSRGWFSDRDLRKPGMYYRYAEAVGLSREEWKPYMGKNSPHWDMVPPSLAASIRAAEQDFRKSCYMRYSKPKHKYAYLAGRTKNETKRFREEFADRNPDLVGLPHPKVRGS